MRQFFEYANPLSLVKGYEINGLDQPEKNGIGTGFFLYLRRENDWFFYGLF